MDDRKKMTYTNFPIFLKICLAAMVEIVVTLGPRFFCNLHHKFFDETKKLKLIPSYPGLILGSRAKTKKFFFLPTYVSWNCHISCVQIFFQNSF